MAHLQFSLLPPKKLFKISPRPLYLLKVIFFFIKKKITNKVKLLFFIFIIF